MHHKGASSRGCLHNSLQLLSQKVVQTTFSQLTFTHLQNKTLKQFAVAVVSTNNSRQCDFIRKSEPNSHSTIQLEILHVRYPIFVALLSNEKSIEPINATTTYLLRLIAYLILIRILQCNTARSLSGYFLGRENRRVRANELTENINLCSGFSARVTQHN